MKLLITLTEDDLRGKRMNFQLSYLDPFKRLKNCGFKLLAVTSLRILKLFLFTPSGMGL
jgi:hypothetical protein